MAQQSSKQSVTVYAFIDSQNLNLGVQSMGWRLDYRKFRHYLRVKYGVNQAYLFLGYKASNERLYASLRRKGYIIIFKPTIIQADGTIKGNVDAELVLHAMLQYPNYDQAIIVSGDGDFYCLAKYLVEQGKLLRILVPTRHFSNLLKRFSNAIVRVDKLRDDLEFKKLRQIKQPGSGRSKP